MERVSISKYIREREKFMKKHEQYRRELVAINTEEYDEVRKLIVDGVVEDHDEYCDRYKDDMRARQERREQLKKKFGIFSDIYAFPYYCVATNVEQLIRVFGCDDAANLGYCKEYLAKYRGKCVKHTVTPEYYGMYIGQGFTPDDIYFVFKDKKTGKEHLVLEVEECDKNGNRPYRVVTNEKGYI